MKKIYVDLGAFDGDTIRAFMLGEIVPNPIGYEMYAFEPNPRFKPMMEKISQKYGVQFQCSAAWTEEGEIDFAVDVNECAFGSSAMSSKRSIWDKGNIIKTPAFDFSKWIEQFAGNEVVVKMDIEGAEFPILEKMIEAGTIKIITDLFVEFHPNKVQWYTTNYTNELIERLKKFTNVHNWH